MLKTIIIFTSVLVSFLFSKEPSLVFLNRVISNEVQNYSIGNFNFNCKPYGVITVDELYVNTTSDSKCKKSVLEFYKKNPNARYFSLNLLKIKQMYHLEVREKECLVFAQGEKSLSEILLENGLAFQKPHFKDKEYKFIFYQAQQRAKYTKKGLWSENIMVNCISEINK